MAATRISGNERRVLQGIGVSSGVAYGCARLMHEPPGVDEGEPACVDPQSDMMRVRAAMAAVAAALRERSLRAADDMTRAMLAAGARLAEDRGLDKSIMKRLSAGDGVTRAVANAVDGYIERFSKAGGMMAERITDLNVIRSRLIAELRGLPVVVPQHDAVRDIPVILVARDLAPADAAALDPAAVRGLVLEEGGATGHTAILAAERGIPAVVRAHGVLEAAADDSRIVLDGGAGEVIVNPDSADWDCAAERAARRRALLHGGAACAADATDAADAAADVDDSSAMTADGCRILLNANVGTPAEAEEAALAGVDGIGLLRSEFLFLNRSQAPTEAEQAEAYTRAVHAFDGRPVAVRTFDAGADKPLAFARSDGGEASAMSNPALGVRGIRLGMRREDLLDTQLAALADAYRASGNCLKVMAPMVATVQETQWFVDKAHAAGLPYAGIMIETPAAAVQSASLLAVADFASIGTNDLAQYTMAADRLDGSLSDLLDSWQPATLRMIRMTVEGGLVAGKPVGVCGEAAGDPLLALVFAGFGIRSLSMAWRKAAAVRSALRLHSLADCQRMAQAALNARSATEARQSALALADARLRDVL
ncbi:phosphoenolpyruvate-protein phosphotransferase [Bifidobacterium myosotis]|uniref:Phosphoenolpyruvate-protein phosphotransferase n=1 Tax=Bifidobacterium myosotis TaxID=1630166 RepID=A0A261FRF3_9BIFI|nr:putative PEP-binding protein [Bifidobacterium myosotis]OZG61737.1 phosphoenolpyruvate-protein phosphotransferase [Bifidobacterium myosotis]